MYFTTEIFQLHINYTLLHIEFSQELLLHKLVNSENFTDFLFVFVKTYVISILTVMHKVGNVNFNGSRANQLSFIREDGID